VTRGDATTPDQDAVAAVRREVSDLHAELVRYNLVAWNEGSIRESRPIVIPDEGGPVEADFTLR